MPNGINWSTPWRSTSNEQIQRGLDNNAARRAGSAGLGVNHPLEIAAKQQSVNPTPPPGPGWGRAGGGTASTDFIQHTPYAGHDGTANDFRGVSGGYMKAQGIASMAGRNMLERSLDNQKSEMGLRHNAILGGHAYGNTPALSPMKPYVPGSAYHPMPMQPAGAPGGILNNFKPSPAPPAQMPPTRSNVPYGTNLPTDANLAYGWEKQAPVRHVSSYRGMNSGSGGGAPKMAQAPAGASNPGNVPPNASPFLRAAYARANELRRLGYHADAAAVEQEAHGQEIDNNYKVAQTQGQTHQNTIIGQLADMGIIPTELAKGISAGTTTPEQVRQAMQIHRASQQQPQVPQVQAPQVNTANLPAAATPSGTPAPPQPQPPATPMLPMTSGEGYAHLVNALGTDDFNRIIPADPNARGEIKDVLNRAYSSGYGDRGLNDPNSPLARALRAHLTGLYGEDAMNYEATGPHELFWNWAGPDNSPEALRAAAFARGGQKLPTSIKLPTVPKVAAPPQPQRPPGLLGLLHWGY